MVVALARWPLDYFIKAHASPDELYVQVGDQAEQAYWGPPETMATPRTPYRSVSRQAEHDREAVDLMGVWTQGGACLAMLMWHADAAATWSCVCVG